MDTQKLPLLTANDSNQTTRVPMVALPSVGNEPTVVPGIGASERATGPLRLMPSHAAAPLGATPPLGHAARSEPILREQEPPRPVAPIPSVVAQQPAPPVAMNPVAAAPVVAPSSGRRWPLAFGSWVGGVVAGMLLLTLLLGVFGKPRAIAASTGDPTAAWDTSITLTDAYLTAQARKNGTGQVEEPVLHIQADGKVALQGKANLLGRTVPVSATLQPAVVEGKFQMEVVQLQVGALPLPEAVTKQLAGGVAGSMQPPAGALATTVVKLETSDGKLVLYNKVK